MPVITNNIRKFTASLGNIKHRRKYACFKAEGSKCVIDTLGHFDLKYLFATDEWIMNHVKVVQGLNVIPVSKADIIQMSSLSAPTSVIAVYSIPEYTFDVRVLHEDLVIALDGIQDPGNLGTIIRTADWFGIRNIICSRDTVDVYNPKVIQSTMGAISRVKVHYCNLCEVLSGVKDVSIYGTFLDGRNIYTESLNTKGVIIMGNEGNGISSAVAGLVTDRLFIPSYSVDGETSESLNVGVATAITVSLFRKSALIGYR